MSNVQNVCAGLAYTNSMHISRSHPISNMVMHYKDIVFGKKNSYFFALCFSISDQCYRQVDSGFSSQNMNLSEKNDDNGINNKRKLSEPEKCGKRRRLSAKYACGVSMFHGHICCSVCSYSFHLFFVFLYY